MPTGTGADYYHAAWFSNHRGDWPRRPTAFRILVRLYDPGLRVPTTRRRVGLGRR
jgi:hypothetical protein